MKKQYIYIMTIVLIVMVSGFLIFSFLEEPKESEDKRVLPKRLKIIQNPLNGIDRIKEKGPSVRVEDIFKPKKVLSEEETNKILKEEIRTQLEKRISSIFKECENIKTKKSMKKKFQTMQYNDAFLADLNGNTLYGKNNTEDMDARSIALEQIQKVGRNGEGFIISRVDDKGTKRYILVKGLGFSRLFIGVDTYFPKDL